MRIPRVITVAFLEDCCACEDQVEIFEKEWPKGAEVTKENVIRALELGLDLDWLVCGFASAVQFEYWRVNSRLVHGIVKAEVFVRVWKSIMHVGASLGMNTCA